MAVTMEVLPAILTLVALQICGGYGYETTYDLLDYCGGGLSYDRKVSREEKLYVRVREIDWPLFKTECVVVFKADESLDELTYEFQTFSASDIDASITFDSKYSSYFANEATYSRYNRPSTYSSKSTNRYLRVTVKRSILSGNSIEANFFVYIEGHDDDGSSNILAIILGATFGAIGLIVLLVVIIVMCVMANARRTRAARGATVTYNNTANGTGTTAVYPYMAPPTNYGQTNVQFVYPAAPGGYPATQPNLYPGPPPQYYGHPAGHPAQPTLPAEQPAPTVSQPAEQPSAPAEPYPKG